MGRCEHFLAHYRRRMIVKLRVGRYVWLVEFINEHKVERTLKEEADKAVENTKLTLPQTPLVTPFPRITRTGRVPRGGAIGEIVGEYVAVEQKPTSPKIGKPPSSGPPYNDQGIPM
jgi:hypothetical protein